MNNGITRMIAVAAVFALPLLAYADGETPSIPGGGPPSTGGPSATPEAAPVFRAPSKNNETFKALRTKCETEAVCGKVSGDVCAEAAAVLLSADPPDEFHDMNETQKVRIALRLLEKGVDTSNIAAGRAYDWYSKTEFFGITNLGGYTDGYRANELMQLMIKRGYPGGPLRKARETLSIFSLSGSEGDRAQACNMAKQYLADGKLDEDSTAIAREMLDTGSCKNLFQQNQQQK